MLKVHEHDNVAVTLSDVSKGLTNSEFNIVLQQDVPRGHKVALQDIAKGEPIVKYGFPIGVASCSIASGEHVHSHNLKTSLDGTLEYTYVQQPLVPTSKTSEVTFRGYRRPNGKVGIRNQIWIINTVGCVNHAAEMIAKHANEQLSHLCDGVFAFSHPFGCSQLGDDLAYTSKVLAALASHPNAGAVLVVGLGCENNQLSRLIEQIDRPEERIAFFNSQMVEDEIAHGLELVKTLVDKVSADVQIDIPINELVLGMKCGGSDGLSGLTANPLLGQITDRHTAHGGKVILTETPEMFGAEQILMDRASDETVFQNIVNLVNEFKEYFITHKQPIYENPSPGNKEGGLTTLEEKSIGAIQKGGQAIIQDVLEYASPVKSPGLSLLQAPGNDAISSTALVASGAHIILFTTGRGTPLGFPVPTLKVASNSTVAKQKRHWIDFDAGVLTSGQTMSSTADALNLLCIETASGKLTKNEINNIREIAIWKRGVTL